MIGNVRAFPADLSWRGSNALFSCLVGTCCSCTCPYAAAHHVDGTQLAASGGLGPVPQMYPRDANASRPEACCPGTSALSFAPHTQRMHGCSRLCRRGGSAANAAPAQIRVMPWRQLVAGCIVDTCYSCVCPYDATRHVDSTQLAASDGLGTVPRILSCDVSLPTRRRHSVSRACPRFPMSRVDSARLAPG